MVLALKNLVCIVFGFGSGVVISGAVFAFITVIGIVQRLAQKTSTSKYIKLYEEAIIVGGIFGTSTMFIDYHFPIGKVLTAILSFVTGIFYGCLAMSLAEVLDVIPILTRRGRVQQGMFYFILAIAIGKCVGAILYFTVEGFYRFGD